MNKLGDLSNDELLARLRAHLGRGHVWLAGLLAYLAEVDARRLYAEHACPSMWDFCVRRLGMSEGEAQRRIAAARVVRWFPVAREYLERGEIHLCAVYEMHKHLTEGNHEELLREAVGKSTKAVAEMIAARFPRPDVFSCIEPLAPQPALPVGPPETKRPSVPSSAAAPPATAPATSQVHGRVEPLSATRYRVELTISAETRAKLERVRDLMRHRNPTGDLATIFDLSLDLLVMKLEKERLGKTTRSPRKMRSVTTAVDEPPWRPSDGAASAERDGVARAQRNGASAERNGPSAERNGPSAERNGPSAERNGRVLSAPLHGVARAERDGVASAQRDGVVSAPLHGVASAERDERVSAPPHGVVSAQRGVTSADRSGLFSAPPHGVASALGASALSDGHSPESHAGGQPEVSERHPVATVTPTAWKPEERALSARATINELGPVKAAPATKAARRRHIPRAIRREIYARDGEQCTYVDAEGNRCPARGFLELDHIQPKALGGGDEAANLRLRCRVHNHLHAEHVFGRDYVEQRIHFRHRECAATQAPSFETAARGLRSLGFRERQVREVIAQLATKLDAKTPVERIIIEALGLLT